MTDEATDTRARVTFLPFQTGDGYGWGGGVILTIMGKAIPLGEGREAEKLAKEIARRWNLQEPVSHDRLRDHRSPAHCNSAHGRNARATGAALGPQHLEDADSFQVEARTLEGCGVGHTGFRSGGSDWLGQVGGST